MKKFAIALLICFTLTGCGSNEADNQMAQFSNDINAMCDNIAAIDTEINSIEFSYEDEEGFEKAKEDLISQLQLLEEEFTKFGEMDFPTEFDYLEEMADESSSYMSEAVNSYISMYGDDNYSANMDEYAKENYSRAYKRVNIILALLRGETPDEEGLTLQ